MHTTTRIQSDRQRECIVILDFGGQYTQLIARRIRECHVYCEILPFDFPLDEVIRRRPNGIILSGGPSSVYGPDAPHSSVHLYDLDIPILGICYGLQLMAHQLGGDVRPAEQREYGAADLTILDPDPLCNLFDGVGVPGDTVRCWMSHGDTVINPPAGFRIIATTFSAPVAAMINSSRRLYGVQFHPEVAHTQFGQVLLRTFLTGPCGCCGSWTSTNIVSEATAQIQSQVGDAGVVCGVSGGIDSCCVAALMHRAVGTQLTCIFVDHGLLRKGEARQVRDDFAAAFGIKLICVDAKESFFAALKGVTDPEQKRKVIGTEFVRVFEEYANRLPDVEYLAQGTLYPDVIESGGSKAATIKTHHNVGGLPEDMALKVIEPLRQLFKDEARAVATELGLPDEIVWRHPFPGPGLAIRILGEVTEDRVAIVQEADAIFIEELHRAHLYRELSQALVVLAPVHSVGVMGDQRTYGNPIILRAVVTQDFMTAAWARLPYELLERVSSRIVNEVEGVNRVVYDISSKPPATIEWE